MLVQLQQFVLNSLSGAGDAEIKTLVRQSLQLPEGHIFTCVCVWRLCYEAQLWRWERWDDVDRKRGKKKNETPQALNSSSPPRACVVEFPEGTSAPTMTTAVRSMFADIQETQLKIWMTYKQPCYSCQVSDKRLFLILSLFTKWPKK